jgi:hypothetical protein
MKYYLLGEKVGQVGMLINILKQVYNKVLSSFKYGKEINGSDHLTDRPIHCFLFSITYR